MSNKIYSPINYYSSRSILCMFDSVYKLGVRDAIDIGDEAQCVEFCDKMYEPMKFGRIVNDYEYKWREWQFRIMELLRKDAKYARMGLDFFDCISNYGSYLACVFPIAMDFYMKGIKDYWKYPNEGKWLLFEKRHFAEWGADMTVIKMDGFVRLTTEFCFDRVHLDKALMEEMAQARAKYGDKWGEEKRKSKRWCRIPLSEAAYNNFRLMIWRHTRTKEYATKGKPYRN